MQQNAATFGKDCRQVQNDRGRICTNVYLHHSHEMLRYLANKGVEQKCLAPFLYAEEHLDKTERVKCNGKLYGRNEKHNEDLRAGDS